MFSNSESHIQLFKIKNLLNQNQRRPSARHWVLAACQWREPTQSDREPTRWTRWPTRGRPRPGMTPTRYGAGVAAAARTLSRISRRWSRATRCWRRRTVCSGVWSMRRVVRGLWPALMSGGLWCSSVRSTSWRSKWVSVWLWFWRLVIGIEMRRFFWVLVFSFYVGDFKCEFLSWKWFVQSFWCFLKHSRAFENYQNPFWTF